MPFDYGQAPNIAVFNQATVDLGVDLDALILALQKYVDDWVAAVWNTPCRLIKTVGFVKDYWAMILLDDSDQAGALAYHDLTPEGLPIAKVFVKTTLRNGETVGGSASHELAEMLIDPGANIMTTGPNPRLTYAYEIADPCEEILFKINGIQMSDFVFPAYFESFRRPGSARFDVMAKLTAPFQISRGGYQIVFDGTRWTNRIVSEEKAMAFLQEDRRGHRSEMRRRPLEWSVAEVMEAE